MKLQTRVQEDRIKNPIVRWEMPTTPRPPRVSIMQLPETLSPPSILKTPETAFRARLPVQAEGDVDKS